jgi:transposase
MADDAPPPSAPDRAEIDAVASVLRRMIADGHGDDAVALVVKLLTQMRAEIDALQHKLQVALRLLYGRKSEKLTEAERAELAALLGDEAKPDAARPPAADGGSKPTKKPLPPGAGHGRGSKPEGLPEERTKALVSEADRVCPQCQSGLHPFGQVECWRVEYLPGHFVVQVTEREQLSCRRCRDVVVTAPMPPTVIDGSEAGAGLLAKVLVDKGEDHLPIERQQRRLEREGLAVPISTLTGWWSQSADLLRPLQGALAREAMSAWLPQVDGTGLDVLDRDHPKGLRHGTIWTAVGGRAVAFVFTPAKSRGLGELLALRPALDADGVALVAEAAPNGETGAATDATAHEGGEGRDGDDDGDDGEEGATGSASAGALRRVGPVQCDGEKIFGSALRKLGVACVLVHCWMHARRYFERAQKARDPRANLPLALIGRMYDLERLATEQGVSGEERARRRQAESWPLLEELRKWVEETRPKAPPSTPLGKAIRYVEVRWLSLCVFVLDGRIPMDDGEVERFIRRIAVGRNNWLFTGSDDAAERLCTVASLCATCRKLGIDPWAYLRDALLAAGSGISPSKLIAGFTPWAWAEKKAQQADAEKVAMGGVVVG